MNKVCGDWWRIGWSIAPKSISGSVLDSHAYTYDDISRPTARTSSGVVSTFAYNERSEVVSAQIGTNHFAPAYDNNGNVTKYIDENGSVVAAYEYDDFGRRISQSGSMADFFRIRFSTKYFDSETGLYYYGYRFYLPTLMRWINRDPIGEDGGFLREMALFCKVVAVEGSRGEHV